MDQPDRPARSWTLEEEEIYRLGVLKGQNPSASVRSLARELNRDPHTIARVIREFTPESTLSRLRRELTAVPLRPFIRPSIPGGRSVDPFDQFRRHFVLWRALACPAGANIRALAVESNTFPFKFGRSTAERLLQQMKIQATYCIKVPAMTEGHKRYREKWAAAIQEADIWQLPWVFTDEASVQDDPNRTVIRRVPGLFLPDYAQSFQCHPNKVMVWGAIAEGYKSPLMRVEGNIDQKKYQEILLSSGLFESMDRIHGPGRWVFMDDGAPAHTAKSTRQFLSARCRVLTKELQWPPHSPDLNVIENMWSVLKAGMRVQRGMTPDALFALASGSWQSITMETVHNLVNSFESRVQACSALHGECLNGHRRVVKAFREGEANGFQVVRDEVDLASKVSLFKVQSGGFFRGWNEQHMREYLVTSIRIVDGLPARTKKMIGMPHGFRALQ